METGGPNSKIAICWLMMALCLASFIGSKAQQLTTDTIHETQPPTDPNDGERYQACGSQLEKLIELVCSGHFVDRRSIGTVITRHHRATRVGSGIKADCCWQTCTTDTMREYCPI